MRPKANVEQHAVEAAAHIASSKADRAQWLAIASSTGIDCGGVHYRTADEVEGTNFGAWVLVEDDIVSDVIGIVQPRPQNILIGWDWQTGMSKDAITLTVDYATSDGVAIPNFGLVVSEATITTRCGGWGHTAYVGGGRTVTYTPRWTFSGALLSTTYTHEVSETIGLSSTQAFEWGVSAKGAVSFGGSFSYGQSWSHTETDAFTVNVQSISKTVQGVVTLTGEPQVPVIQPDAVVFDNLGSALCASFWAQDQNLNNPHCVPTGAGVDGIQA
jgi:hypothetical protein